MNSEDAKFLIEHDPGVACEVARISLRSGGNTMWRTLKDAGLAKAIRKNAGARRSLLNSMIVAPSTNDAVEMLKNILDDLKPKQRISVFNTVRQSSVVISYWIESCGFNENPDRKIHISQLLKAVSCYDLDINTPFKGIGRRGGTYDSSVMRECVSNIDWVKVNDNNKYLLGIASGVKLLFEFGAKLDYPTKQYILGLSRLTELKLAIDWFYENAQIKYSDWLTEQNSTHVVPENIAFIQSLVAKKVIVDLVSTSNTAKP